MRNYPAKQSVVNSGIWFSRAVIFAIAGPQLPVRQ
jgi:hypothetical protein